MIRQSNLLSALRFLDKSSYCCRKDTSETQHSSACMDKRLHCPNARRVVRLFCECPRKSASQSPVAFIHFGYVINYCQEMKAYIRAAFSARHNTCRTKLLFDPSSARTAIDKLVFHPPTQQLCLFQTLNRGRVLSAAARRTAWKSSNILTPLSRKSCKAARHAASMCGVANTSELF